MDDSPAQPRILIARLSHIGDCVLTLPMVAELRRAFPQAHIVWAMESPSYKLLGNVPWIDEFIAVPRRWLKSLSAIRSMRKLLAAHRFDVAVDPQSILKSGMLARLSGARTRLGFRGIHGREMTPWLNNVLVEPTQSHLLDRSLELIRPLVPDVAYRETHLPVVPTAARAMQQWATAKLRETPSAEMPLFAVINPGASWPSKRWELDRFAQVASDIWRATGLISVLTWAGDEEWQMAKTIHKLAPQATRPAPPTSLPELAALTQLATVFIGCDTGPMHIAAAVGTPCVGLYGPTRPGDSGAYGKQHIALQAAYQAGSCRERRRGGNDAMRKIEAAAVSRAALSVINQVDHGHRNRSVA